MRVPFLTSAHDPPFPVSLARRMVPLARRPIPNRQNRVPTPRNPRILPPSKDAPCGQWPSHTRNVPMYRKAKATSYTIPMPWVCLSYTLAMLTLSLCCAVAMLVLSLCCAFACFPYAIPILAYAFPMLLLCFPCALVYLSCVFPIHPVCYSYALVWLTMCSPMLPPTTPPMCLPYPFLCIPHAHAMLSVCFPDAFAIPVLGFSPDSVSG